MFAKKISLWGSTFLLAFAGSAHAAGFGHSTAGFGYSYVEGGVNHYTADGVTYSVEANGSLAVGSNIHLLGGIQKTKLDSCCSDIDPITQYEVGAGVHGSITQTTDLVLDASFVRMSAESNWGSSGSSNGYTTSAGIRSKLMDQLEGDASISYSGLIGEDYSEVGYEVGGRYYLLDNISAGAHYRAVKGVGDSGVVNASLRAEFL